MTTKRALLDKKRAANIAARRVVGETRYELDKTPIFIACPIVENAFGRSLPLGCDIFNILDIGLILLIRPCSGASKLGLQVVSDFRMTAIVGPASCVPPTFSSLISRSAPR